MGLLFAFLLLGLPVAAAIYDMREGIGLPGQGSLGGYTPRGASGRTAASPSAPTTLPDEAAALQDPKHEQPPIF